MTDATRATHTFRDFRLASGEVLPEVTIAYVTRGTLNPDGRNAILVTHGYTSGHGMIEAGGGSAEGAWNTLVGPGAPIDTDRYFVVCSNMLGSSYGSTNAASIDPRTGKPYGSRFPVITVADIVTAQHRLLAHLGVRHLRAVIGPSYGGFQAFQWAVTFPDFMDGVVPVVTSPLPPSTDRVAGLMKWFGSDPNFHGGDYYDTDGVKATLTKLRVDTLTRYGMADSLADRFPDKTRRDAELRRIAAAWADVFDANSLFILGRAMESYDITRDYAKIRVPVLYVLSRTDALFPPSLAPGVMAGLRQAGVEATYFALDSDHGHLASGADAAKWAPALRDFIAGLEDRERVASAVRALYRAMLAHDVPALDAMLTEDLVYVHSPGFAETKRQFLDGVRDGLYEYERVRPVDERIRVSGDMASVYTTLDFMGGARGKPHPPVTLITTLVWVRQDGSWRMMLRQATRVP
ncbi:MAG: alpha/beta fold hydrolase [Acetobacteraceae bacterium]